ncbi:MAG: VanZ family protein, partial [Acidobacteria bacterium]|nr:VanZ family protein [Acidobacteriota bacterium]
MRFVLATTVAALLVLSAPFIGQIRTSIRTAFPGQFVAIVGIVVGVAVVAGIVAALIRIRDCRALRYGTIAAALVIGIAYSASLGTGNPEVDAVERFHFVEYGLITLLFYRAWRPVNDGSVFVLPVLAGIVVGTLEEWVQWFIPARIGEVRDVVLNCVAIACGLLFSIGLDPPERLSLTLRRGSLRRIGVAFVLATLVFALFFHAVHLGYAVSSGEGITFRSRYGRDELKRIAAERAVSWKGQELAAPPRLSREDQYMSEGLWHVQW